MLFALLLVVMPAAVAAQQLPVTFTPHTSDDAPPAAVQARGGKSPTLAAILSWLVWPGVGSYYAGNSGHGTRHLAIGVAAAGVAIPLLVTCDNDGFCDFDNDTARLSVVAGLGAVWVANSIWSIITAVNDAEDYNARLQTARVSLKPAVTPLAATPGQGTGDLGVQLVGVRF
jgi:hypothetical protein